jgi:hypothetical protein
MFVDEKKSQTAALQGKHDAPTHTKSEALAQNILKRSTSRQA